MTAQRLYFINRFFWPDQSATSQILSEVAFALAKQGHDVNIIASRLSYSEIDTRYRAKEKQNKVSIHRIATSGFGRTNLVGRTLDYLSFYLSAFITAMLCIQPGDIVIVKTDPPLLSVLLAILLRAKRAKQINWLQDIYPETATRLGLKVFDGPLGKLLTRVRNSSLRRSQMNIAIGQIMADRLLNMGVEPSKVIVIPNFVDDNIVKPVRSDDNPLRKSWGFTNSDFIVGYSGNLGRAHELNTVLKAAEKLQLDGHSNIKFLFIGGGHLHRLLDEERNRRLLSNIVIKPYQPFDMLNYSMTVPDVHWLSLRPELEGLIVPSKFYSAAASGRPVIMIGDTQGEIGRQITANENGRCYLPGDYKPLANFLHHMSINRGLVDKMGGQSRALIELEYAKNLTFEKWFSLINKISHNDN